MKIIKIICAALIITTCPMGVLADTPSALSVRTYDASVATTNLAGVNQAVTIAPNGYGTAVFSITGTFVGTLIPEVSVDGTNYYPISVAPTAGGNAVQSITSIGSWHTSVSAFADFRVRESAYTSGTAVVTVRLASGVIDLNVL